MKRFTLFGLLIVLLVTVAVANEPVKEFPSFFDWQVIENEPAENYTVLAVARVIDGDTFEFWLHIAPRLAYFADVRLANVDTLFCCLKSFICKIVEKWSGTRSQWSIDQDTKCDGLKAAVSSDAMI